MRRREMIPSDGGTPVEDWDYEWSYMDGVSLTADGWTKESSGNASSSYGQTGQVMQSQSNAYVRLTPPADYQTMTVGVMEVDLICNYNEWGNQNARICLSNGADGVQVFFNGMIAGTGKGLKLMDTDPPSSCTLLSAAPSGVETVLRLEIDNGIGRVYKDGVLLSEFSTSIVLYAVLTRIWSQNSFNLQTIIKSVKIKKGRL